MFDTSGKPSSTGFYVSLSFDFTWVNPKEQNCWVIQ